MAETTILVTGAAGFIGSHTCEALLARGDRVIGVDNFNDYYSPKIKRQNAAAVAKAGGARFEMQEVDITDGPAITRVIESARPTAIIHLAAQAGVRPSIERPAFYCQTNVTGTANLLQAAVSAGVKKFLLASSSSVYGNNAVPFSEEQSVDLPISPYAATKKSCELLAHSFWHLHKLPVHCLRFFTVFGPRQRPDLAISKFTHLIDKGQTIPVFGDGSTSRDYTFVADTVAGILASLDRCDRYRIYNLGGSHPITLSQLIAEVERAVGKTAVLDRQPAQRGDVERTFADLTRSRAELGYSPKVSIREGIERYVKWYRQGS